MTTLAQDKQKEIAFFDSHAAADAYDVFTPESNVRLISTCMRLAGLEAPARVADLGCGSGVFTDLLHRLGFDAVGLDLSPKLIARGRANYPRRYRNRRERPTGRYRDSARYRRAGSRA